MNDDSDMPEWMRNALSQAEVFRLRKRGIIKDKSEEATTTGYRRKVITDDCEPGADPETES